MLHGLSAGDIIIEYCRHLPELNKYISQSDDSTTDEVKCIPNTIAEANALRQSFKGLLNDIDITVKVTISIDVGNPRSIAMIYIDGVWANNHCRTRHTIGDHSFTAFVQFGRSRTQERIVVCHFNSFAGQCAR